MTAVKTETKLYPRIYGKIVLTLENCILSDLDSKPTPSELDGLDPETETDLRILGCELIQTAGILLRLPQVAMATGQVLFQRFYYTKSFVRHSMETTAMSCVCLASKIEEAPRRIRDVINVFHHIKQVRLQKQLTPIVLDQNYINLKSQVIKAERRVLKELGFCVHVNHHPHKLIVMYLKYLEFESNQRLMQRAWNYMNDSFRTDCFVRYQPEKIACACIYLTARELGIPLPGSPPWFGVFKASEQEIHDIVYRILALYKRSKPNLEKLEDAVEKLKTAYDARKKDKGGPTTPPVAATTTADRTNGAHNAWGGFIARAEPLPAKDEERSPRRKSKSRSRSPASPRSKSSTPVQRSPDDEKPTRRKRSRTPVKASKKKSRHYSRSTSRSPYRKHKKSDSKKYDKYSDKYDKYEKYERKGSVEKDRYRDDYDNYKSYRKEKQYRNNDKNYYNGKEKYRSEKAKYRDRSPRDRRW